MTSIILRVLLALVVLYMLMPAEDVDLKEMDLLRRRIEFWRNAAEYCGRKVIRLEVKHATLADQNRTV